MTTTTPVIKWMVSLQVVISECVDYNTRLWYERSLKWAGAEIVDFKINYKTNDIKYYLRLNAPDGHSIRSFKRKVSEMTIGDRMTFIGA